MLIFIRICHLESLDVENWGYRGGLCPPLAVTRARPKAGTAADPMQPPQPHPL